MTLPKFERIAVDVDRGIWTVSMRRVLRANLLDAKANREMADAFDAFFASPDAIAAIVTGTGTDFCPGMDYGNDARGLDLPPSGFGGLTNRFDDSKPIIAAVNGDAFDEGFELVLACDLVIAYENARFGFDIPEAGRAFAFGGAHRLVRRIPYSKAMDVLLCGARISAREGVLLGLVNDIASLGEELTIARARAERVASMPKHAVYAAKQSAVRGLAAGSVEAAMRASYPEQESLVQGEGYGDSVAALAALRKSRVI
jgi:enoyl-CoA hydratase/carnithine racemase